MMKKVKRILYRLANRLRTKECENCCLSWEDRSMEGDGDCGCVLYGDIDSFGIACIVPNWLLRGIRRKKDSEYAEAMSRQGDAMAEWFKQDASRHKLFLQALREKLFTDLDGRPKQPMYHSPSGKYHPFTPVDDWQTARMNYEQNMADGLPPDKAFKKAIAEYLTPELYYDAGGGKFETFRIFANCMVARERYHALLRDKGLE